VGRFLRTLPWEDPRQAAVLARDVRDAGARRVWATLGHSVRHRMEDLLVEVRVPVLVFGGARDRVAPAAWRHRVVALVSGGGGTAREVTVAGAAHNAATTAGDAVADAVTGFLTACPNGL
jgi:pimeloyl-ACP methyl ester carboxylesterase